MTRHGVALSAAAESRGIRLPGRELPDESVPAVEYLLGSARLALKTYRHGAAGPSMAAAEAERMGLEEELHAVRTAQAQGIGVSMAVAAGLAAPPPSRRMAPSLCATPRAASAASRTTGAKSSRVLLAGGDVSAKDIRDALAAGMRPPTPTRPDVAESRWWEAQFAAARAAPAGDTQVEPRGPAARLGESSKLQEHRANVARPFGGRDEASEVLERFKGMPTSLDMAFGTDRLDEGALVKETKALMLSKQAQRSEDAARSLGQLPAEEHRARRRHHPASVRSLRCAQKRATASAASLASRNELSRTLPVQSSSRTAALAGKADVSRLLVPVVSRHMRAIQ